MAKKQLSLKQLAIDKDNTTILIAVALASFVVVFSLVASNALLKQRSYQAKVIGKKKVALQQMRTNAEEIEKLQSSYQAFASAEQNVLGGSATGTGDRDGDNPRLVLDALPSKYDFPALTSSMEKVFKSYNIESITGTDDEVNQAATESTPTPQPVEIPISISMNSSPQAAKNVLELFEKSIRPIQIDKLSLNSSSDELTINVTAKTYFQPQKKFEVRMEQVK